MTTVLVVLAVLIVLIGGLVAFAMTRPNDFRLERSAHIRARPDRVFPLINDFHAWTQWSPWENRDADLKRIYGGSPSGKGATYEWEGRKTGKGRMEIVDAIPNERVTIKLDFFKPFEAHNTAEFTMVPEGDATNVRWVMAGPNAFIGKLMSVFFSMDKIVGKDFEAGLAAMKAAAEKK